MQTWKLKLVSERNWRQFGSVRTALFTAIFPGQLGKWPLTRYRFEWTADCFYWPEKERLVRTDWALFKSPSESGFGIGLVGIDRFDGASVSWICHHFPFSFNQEMLASEQIPREQWQLNGIKIEIQTDRHETPKRRRCINIQIWFSPIQTDQMSP